MPMVRAMRLLNAVEAGTTTGAQLQTLLTADPGRLAELNVLLGMRGQARRMAASSTAMAAVIASSTAMAAVAASSTAMAAVAASSTAMAAVAASSTAMAAVAASSTARAAVNASPTALAAVEASPSGLVHWVLVPAGQNPASFANMTAVAASSTAMAAVIASSTAMTAVAASSTAMAAVAASSTAMAAVIASSTAMAAVWAADTAADAVLTSATARLAVYNADPALAALQAAPTQVQRQIGIGGRTVTNTNSWSGVVNLVPNGTRLIILRRWYSGTESDFINWARGSTTTGSGHGPVAGSGGRTLYTGTQARGCVSGTYTDNGTMPTTNDATGNFVCAANGLRRDNAQAGATQNVIYITV